MPSTQLAMMYHSAVFDTTVGPVGWHPRTNVEEREPISAPIKPYLQLGDIFVWNGEADKDGNQLVYILISAACDLSYSPDIADKRPFPTNLPLLFLRGTLLPLQEPPKMHASLQTEIFMYHDKMYRIFWDKKHFVSIEYGKFFDWKPITTTAAEGMCYQRVARMRLPFVLEVQHEFTNNLSRIATPVAPPLFNPVRLQIMYVSQDSNAKAFSEATEDLVSFVTYRKDNKQIFQYQLSQKGIAFLYQEMIRLLDQPPTDIHHDSLQKLRSFVNNFFGKLERLNTTFKADEIGSSWLNLDVLGVVRNKQQESSIDKAKICLWLNLLDDYTVDSAAQAETCDV